MCPSSRKLLVYYSFLFSIIHPDLHGIIASLPVIHQNNLLLLHSHPRQSLYLPLRPVKHVTVNTSAYHLFGYPSSNPMNNHVGSSSYTWMKEGRKLEVECLSLMSHPKKCYFDLDNCLRDKDQSEKWKLCRYNDDKLRKQVIVCCERKRQKDFEDNENDNVSKNNKLRRLTQSLMEDSHEKGKISKVMGCGQNYFSFKSRRRSRHQRVKRIVHGIESMSLSHPWMASIFYRGRFICGGSIISENVIVTSAHCVRKGHNFPSLYEVMVGTSRIGLGLVFDIGKIVYHPLYRNDAVYNDVALIFTRTPIVFTESIQPVCLPHALMDSRAMLGNIVTITGFGIIDFEKNTLPETLQEAQVRVVDNKVCGQVYSKLNQNIFKKGVPFSLLCTSSLDEKVMTDACNGDSGGPLTVNIEGRAYLVGIIAFGYKCNQPGFFGVSTAVSHFTRWITSVITKETGRWIPGTQPTIH